MLATVATWCLFPFFVKRACIFGYRAARNDIVAWAVKFAAELDEDIKVIFGNIRFALFVEYPIFVIQLLRLALNRDGTRGIFVGRENVYATSITK